VSPIPIHIAAMVILYGHMSKVEFLDRQTALEDVWMALGMLPRLRWRWERKDLNGEHPLIAKLAEKVFDVQLQQARPVNAPRLISELSWDSDSHPTSPVVNNGAPNGGAMSPRVIKGSPRSVAIGANTKGAHTNTPQQYAGPHHKTHSSPRGANGGHPFPEIPSAWFYPSSDVPFGGLERSDAPADHAANEAIELVLPERGHQSNALGSIGCEPSSEAFLNEERDETLLPTHMNPWVQHMEIHGIGALMPHTQRMGNMGQGPH